MIPFPMEPLMTTVVVEVLPDKGSTIIIPEGKKARRDVVVCIVLAVGPGMVAETGVLIPCGVKPGDLVLVNAQMIALIDYGVRGHLVDRGVDPDYLDKVGIMQYENVLSKLPPLADFTVTSPPITA